MLIKDMSDAALVENYEGLVKLIRVAFATKSRKLGKMLREMDITIAVARKRGIALRPQWDVA